MNGTDETIARFCEMIVRAQEAIDSLTAGQISAEDRTGIDRSQSLKDELIERHMQIIDSATRIVRALKLRPENSGRSPFQSVQSPYLGLEAAGGSANSLRRDYSEVGTESRLTVPVRDE